MDQLVEIIKVLGTPTREEIKCMNPNYTEFKFPQIKAHPWHKVCSSDIVSTLGLCKIFFCCGPSNVTEHSVDCLVWSSPQVFHKRMPPEAVDLVSRLLQYSPNLRCNAVCFLFWLFFSAFLISLDATLSAQTMWESTTITSSELFRSY